MTFNLSANIFNTFVNLWTFYYFCYQYIISAFTSFVWNLPRTSPGQEILVGEDMDKRSHKCWQLLSPEDSVSNYKGSWLLFLFSVIGTASAACRRRRTEPSAYTATVADATAPPRRSIALARLAAGTCQLLPYVPCVTKGKILDDDVAHQAAVPAAVLVFCYLKAAATRRLSRTP